MGVAGWRGEVGGGRGRWMADEQAQTRPLLGGGWGLVDGVVVSGWGGWSKWFFYYESKFIYFIFFFFVGGGGEGVRVND